MPTLFPTRYRTTNWSDYNAALRQRGSLSVWFDPDTVWHAGKTGKRGRPETFSDAAAQVCLPLKVLFGLPLLGDGQIKKRLDEILQALVAPIRKRRAELAQDPGFVLDVIREGTERARVVTEATKKEVVEGLGLFAL